MAEYTDTEPRWYVIHTYSGYENKVKTNLESKVHSLGMEDEIFQIVVPVEDETEIKDGKKKTVKRKVFPGYALVEMIVNERSWYVVRNTPGVTGFVGSGNKPVPLTDAEAKAILKTQDMEEEETKKPIIIDVGVGESVRINEGAFENCPAVVVSVDPEKGKLKVSVEMFGRETITELDFSMIEKLE